MSIRIRTVRGVRVALCAAETDAQPGDVYLDDGEHYALAAKFALDWQGQVIDWRYPEEWNAMQSQKLRDAKEELEKWQREQLPADSVITEPNLQAPSFVWVPPPRCRRCFCFRIVANPGDACARHGGPVIADGSGMLS